LTDYGLEDSHLFGNWTYFKEDYEEDWLECEKEMGSQQLGDLLENEEECEKLFEWFES